jgi:alkyl hydroperoxide reductase subunit F
VVQALNLMAMLNPRIRHVAIDGGLFQQEIEERQIMGVPAVYLNGEMFSPAAWSCPRSWPRSTPARPPATPPSSPPRRRSTCWWGGPAGAAAAIYAARKGIRTGIVAERFGGQTLDTLGIENFISVPETEGPKFAAALEAHVRVYDVDIMANQKRDQLVPAAQPGAMPPSS